MHRKTASVARMLFIFTLLISFLGWADQAMAQARQGSITGHITDTSGGVLKGAQITIEAKGINTVYGRSG